MHPMILINLISSLLSNTSLLVFLSAFLATFIASVMADDQNDRLRNGSFGAIAGSGLGGLAALLTKQQELLLIGVFGSACGATTGWLAYLGLSYMARTSSGRRLVDYHVSGLRGVRERLDFDEKDRLLKSLNKWSTNFGRMVSADKERLLRRATNDERNYWIEASIRNWLTSIVDVFNLVFDALAEQPQYRSRVTIIVFGCSQTREIVGRHWINYAGRLPAHRKLDFPEDSIAYQVICGTKESPFFTTVASANAAGQDRDGAQKQERVPKERSYKTFFSFRLNHHTVLSLDWPGELQEDDPYIALARDLFYLEIAPAISELLPLWSGNVEQAVGLDPLVKP